ncbi:MAG TPA: hypothetical protein VFS00_16375, partial [Polyangiaceae bacterium]|nr:hypothetical protein [Polyangiaceae bacterium]
TDAFGPGVDPTDAWYDEMLVVGDTIVVIGYSYQRSGTEVALFGIDAAGTIKHRSTHQLRSDDYFSSRNYASRVVGDKLVFYSPLGVDFDAPDALDSLPGVRRWRPGAGRGGFRRTAAFSRVYRERGARADDDTTLHTVTVCDLNSPSFDCRATSLVGPPGRAFYVAPEAVYVWVGPAGGGGGGGGGEGDRRARVYRLPLDGGAPAGVRAFGSPLDQFSFLEGDDGFLNVLVQREGDGDAMWGPERGASSALALARVPLASFGAGAAGRPVRYARLPAPPPGVMQNRFVGDYVLYGTGGPAVVRSNGRLSSPDPKADGKIFAYRYASGGEASALRPGHDVQRIEAMGRDALVVGGDGSALHFTALGLGASPRPAGHFELAGAAQGETRSHGFFYQPEGPSAGLLGLPVLGAGRGGEAAAVLFLRNEGLRLRELGALRADARVRGDDRCRASCVDWYGDARPIFLRGRMFALLGYELVEGRAEGERVRELGRISFLPASRSR